MNSKMTRVTLASYCIPKSPLMTITAHRIKTKLLYMVTGPFHLPSPAPKVNGKFLPR